MKKRHERLLWFAKNVLNPLVVRFAGKPRSPFANVRHVGRRSGKPYTTPIVVRRTARGFVMALPYGPDVDWYRNLRAADISKLVWRGREYPIGKPTPLDVDEGLSSFPLPQRLILHRVGVQDFALVTPPARAKAA